MSPDKAAKLAPFINALAEGKTLQVKNRMNQWVDTTNIALDRSLDQYRIKPQPKRYWLYKDHTGIFHVNETPMQGDGVIVVEEVL